MWPQQVPLLSLQAAPTGLSGQACWSPDLRILRTQLVMLWPVASSRFLDLQWFSLPLLLGTSAKE